MVNCHVWIEKLPQINKKNYLLKMNWKILKTFYSSYFIDISHFEEDGTQNYLVFQPM